MKDYKKKYEEALERVKMEMSKDGMKNDVIARHLAETIFPELKESEDEKVRKELIKHLKEGAEGYEPAGGSSDYQRWLAWLEKQGEPTDKGEISDGYHTFNELYYYRMLYNAAFFNMLPKEWVHKSKKHHDGEECFGGGWFIVMANLPTGQISNHYELKDWDLFRIPEKEVADKWDGHTPQEAADRLYKYLLEKQAEQKPAWSEEDNNILNGITTYLSCTACNIEGFDRWYDWLKSLKDRVQPKKEWSEEDDDDAWMNDIISKVENNLQLNKAEIEWLKSLKDRVQPQNHWKPSDKQMMALRWVLNHIPYDSHKEEISGLLEQLKKLKEE